MPKSNFSTEQNEALDLAIDLMRGSYSLRGDNGEQLAKRDLENHLRELLENDIMGGNKSVYQAIRRNKIEIFEIMEEIVNIVIGEDVLNCPFVENFVEVKNRALGDKTEWYSEGGLLTVSSFAGNHWDTNRQSIDLGAEFSLPTEWWFIHVYEELERFLLGITPLEKLMDKVNKSIDKYMKDRLYMQFQSVSSAVPAEFSANGNSEEALGDLCDLVQAAGGYDSITIAGTRGALRKIGGIVPESLIANSQKEAKAATGTLGEWDGHQLMLIPQVKKPNEFKLALGNDKLFIMGGDTKPIKLEFIGDTRSDMDTTGKKYNDMTVDYQIQTKMGMGMIIPEYFGCFTFAG